MQPIYFWQILRLCFFVSFNVLSHDGFPFRQKESSEATVITDMVKVANMAILCNCIFELLKFLGCVHTTLLMYIFFNSSTENFQFVSMTLKSLIQVGNKFQGDTHTLFFLEIKLWSQSNLVIESRLWYMKLLKLTQKPQAPLQKLGITNSSSCRRLQTRSFMAI